MPRLLCLGFALAAGTAAALAQPPGAFVLRFSAAPEPGGGVRVVQLTPNVPPAQLFRFKWRPAAGGRLELVADLSRLDPGDVITDIDGTVPNGPDALRARLTAAGTTAGMAVIRVRDVNTNAPIDYIVPPLPTAPKPGVVGLPFDINFGGQGNGPQPAFQAVNPIDQTHRLLADLADQNGQVVVTAVNGNGPAAQLHQFGWKLVPIAQGNFNRIDLVITASGRLDAGDAIEAVNGTPVATAAACEAAVDRSGRAIGAAVLDVRDRRTGQVARWVVHPSPTAVGVRKIPLPVGRNQRVKVLILADDKDIDLGKGFRQSAADMLGLLAKVPGVSAADVRVLTTTGKPVEDPPPEGQPPGLGARAVPTQFAAGDIAQALAALQVGPSDALVCCVFAHGAYDRNADPNGPTKGHLFTVAGRTLTRRELLDELARATPALTVLLSDSCNAEYVPPVQQQVPVTAYVAGSPLLDHLLRDYRGVVDVNAAALDQRAWYLNGGLSPGGLFTRALIGADAPDTPMSWEGYLGRAGQDLNAAYKAMRATALQGVQNPAGNNLLLLNQPSQDLIVFQRRVTKTGEPLAVPAPAAGGVLSGSVPAEVP